MWKMPPARYDLSLAIRTLALYVPKLEEDLLAVRALIRSNYRIIMDEDDSLSGIFPAMKGEIIA